jgi:hypothetical protein
MPRFTAERTIYKGWLPPTTCGQGPGNLDIVSRLVSLVALRRMVRTSTDESAHPAHDAVGPITYLFPARIPKALSTGFVRRPSNG